jgi:hypothetical protein
LADAAQPTPERARFGHRLKAESRGEPLELGRLIGASQQHHRPNCGQVIQVASTLKISAKLFQGQVHEFGGASPLGDRRALGAHGRKILVPEMKFDDPVSRLDTDAIRQIKPSPGALELHAQDAIGRIDVIKDSVSLTKPTVESKNTRAKERWTDVSKVIPRAPNCSASSRAAPRRETAPRADQSLLGIKGTSCGTLPTS